MWFDAKEACERAHSDLKMIIDDKYPAVRELCKVRRDERDVLKKELDQVRKKLCLERKMTDVLFKIRSDFINEEELNDFAHQSEVENLQSRLENSEIEYKRIKNDMQILMNDLLQKSSELEKKSSLLREADEVLQEANCSYEAALRCKSEENRREKARSYSQRKYIKEIEVHIIITRYGYK